MISALSEFQSDSATFWWVFWVDIYSHNNLSEKNEVSLDQNDIVWLEENGILYIYLY